MKATVDETCIACGLCPQMCPEVFELKEGIAIVIADPVPQEVEASCRDAASSCPVDAIHLEE